MEYDRLEEFESASKDKLFPIGSLQDYIVYAGASQNIDRLIQSQSDITIHETRKKLQLQVSDEIIRKAVLKLGYVYKKKSLHASEQERSRCQSKKGNMEKTYAGERRK